MKKTKLIALMLAALMLTVLLTPAVSAVDFSGFESFWGLIGGKDAKEDDVNGILDSLFGGNDSLNLSDLLSGNGLDKFRELLGGAGGASDDALSNAISSLLGGNSSITEDLLSPDILDKITAMLAGEDIPTTAALEIPTLPTTAPTEESTTIPEETTTLPTPPTEPSTTAPYYPPTTIFSGAQTYTTNPYTTNPYATNPYLTTTNPYETSSYQYVPVVSETVSQLMPSDFKPVVNDYDDEDLQDGISGKMILGIIILVISGGAVVAVALVLKKSRV